MDLQECSRLLRSCTNPQCLSLGRRLHLYCVKVGLESTLFIANCLLQMYVKCGRLGDAHQVFVETTERNTFTWNSLIEGYANSGKARTSLELFTSMPCKNEFSWNVVIAAYAKMGDLEVAQQLFDEMPAKNTFAWNSMVHGCVLYGRIGEARIYFDAMPRRDVASWNKMMTGYVHQGQPWEALRLFDQMKLHQLAIDGFILATMACACADVEKLDAGKQLHAYIVTGGFTIDSVLGSSMINMYSKCGDTDSAFLIFDAMIDQDEVCLSAIITGLANCGRLEDACRIFASQSRRNVGSWNSIISGYATNRQGKEAIELLNEMRRTGIQAEATTITAALTACMNLATTVTNIGKQLHDLAHKVGFLHDVALCSTLIDLYAKNGYLEGACKLFDELEVRDTILLNTMVTAYSNHGKVEQARQVFESIPCRSLISWNSMIVGYSKNGFVIEALELFHEMQMLNLRLDEVGYASMISLCADMSSLTLGEQLFAHVVLAGLIHDPAVGSALIHLYCKCGLIIDSRRLFDSVPKCSDVIWNSMLMGYAHNGYGEEALQVFEDMKRVGVRPGSITFIAVLSACSHRGLVEEGRQLFHAMKHDYGILPMVEHCSCMIDLLARAGCIQEAVDFINNMMFPADASMWTSILSASRAYGEESLGRKAANQLLQLDSANSAAFVQLSNIYATCGEWAKAAQVRKLMQQKGVTKMNPGYSWIDA
ncbi:putative pentatricopeptide repeat-containing protein At1g77010, mitochondrial isoform X1 [Nymphaea colorata]|nr:putative pentatricopeptide repeat-containing protein At1g77010, mitochondrial isoform X1 [Nymphaea colorata]XP_049931640.1 putative pentatricopeptide repeat-containing protein At1g77010, mitochondrial isoform X1 [Nymphaea colorata]